MTSEPQSVSSESGRFVRRIAAGVLLLSVLVLLGWGLDNAFLKSVLPGQVTMKANAAVGFAFAALALGLTAGNAKGRGREWLALGCMLAAVGLGVATLSEYLLSTNLGIDQLFFHDAPGAISTSNPGRMAPLSALNFVLVGLALALMQRSRWVLAAQGLALLVVFDALFGLIGYVYQVPRFYQWGLFTAMAVHTSAAFLALGLGLLGLKPDSVLLRPITGYKGGRGVIGRLLLAVVVVPVALGWLRLQGQLAGFYDTTFGLGLMITTLIGFLVAGIWWASWRLGQSEKALRESEARLNFALEASHIGGWELNLADRTARSTVEHARVFGYGSVQADWSLKKFLGHVLPEDRAAVERRIQTAITAGADWDFECRITRVDGQVRWVWITGRHLRDAMGHARCIAGTVQDITKRKQEEAAALANLAELAQQKFALDRHAIVAMTDVQGRITYVNDKFCALSGYGREELLGQNHRLINSRRHPKEFFAEMYRTITGGAVWHGEICNRSKDGRLYWVETTIVPFKGVDGKPVQFVAIRTDITEQKNTAEALRLANEFLEHRVQVRTSELERVNSLQRAVLDGTVFGVIATKLDGLIDIFNHGAERMLGYSADEMVGKQTPAIIHVREEIAAQAAELSVRLGRKIEPGFEVFTAVTGLGEKDEREWTYVRKDGRRLAVRLSITTLRDGMGAVTGFLSVAQDITGRQEAEADREEMATRLSKLGAQVPGLLFQFRLRPDGSYCFPYASEGIRTLFQCSPEEMREDARAIASVIHPEDRTMVQAAVQESARTLQPLSLEYRLRFADGVERCLQSDSMPEREADGSTLWNGFIVDNTERKRAAAAHQEMAARLVKLGAQLPGMIYQYRLRSDGTSCFPYASEGIREIYRVTPEEVREDASRVFAVLHPDDLARVAESIQVSARTLQPWCCEYRACSADGVERWLQGKSIPEREANGDVLWHGFITDITERKQLEESVQRERELLRRVLDLLPNSVYLKDQDSRFLIANQALARWLGKDSPDQLLERQDAELFEATAAAGFRADDEAVLTGREIREKEEAIVLPNGETKIFLTTKVPFRNATGMITGILGTGTDITARKQAETGLQITRTRLEKTFAAMSEGLVLQDASGSILECNTAAERILGLTRDQITGRAPIDPQWRNVREDGTAFPGAEHPSMVTLLTGKAQRDVIMGVHKADGSLGWIEINSELIGVPGDVEQQVICSFRDVTARRAAEIAMRVSEERFRTLAGHAPVGIFQTDSDGNCVYVNEKWSALTGLTLVAAARDGWRATLHPDDLDAVTEAWRKFSRGENKFALEYRYLHHDDRVMWVAGSAESLRDPAGAVVGYLGTVSDITVNKESEFALRASAAELARQKFALDQHSIVAITDVQGRITYANDKFCEISQYSRDELLGQNHRMINSGHHPKEFFAEIYRVITKGEVWHGEICNRAKDGSLYWEDSTIVPIAGVDGLPIRYVSIRTDMTERKDVEQAMYRALTELEQQKFALDQHALVAVTDVQGRIIHVNQKFCAVSRYRREELLGKTHKLVNSGHHPAEFFGEMYRAIAGGKVWQAEVCNRAKDGSIFWVDTTVVPIMGPDKKPTHYIAIRTDITERKQLGASLALARDQALEASRLKSEFLATMSHEIRTPMNAVIGMTGLLADTPLNAKQEEMTRTIMGGAESLLAIINDILDFSRIEAGKMRVDPVEFNFNRVVEETVMLLASRAQEKHMELTCEIVPWSGARLLGDSGRVRQILTNLMGNAIKFTDRGEVDVTVRAVWETESRTRMRVTIRDTGIGISKEAQSRLFQPFVQADGSTTRRFGGTGLGLAITRQLIELMGGEIGLESEEGKGSLFWFELEFVRCGSLPVEAPYGVPPGKRILVVDDNETNRRILLAQLEHLGLTGEAVPDGASALSRLRDRSSEPWDLVLLDWQIPGLSGMDLAAILKADPVLANLPLVMLSSSGQLTSTEEVEEIFDGFLHKPVTESQLKRCLVRLLSPDLQPVPTRVKLAQEHKPHSLRLLLVEDNLANQRVATLLLEKMGHVVEVAANGLAGLEQLAAKSFDLVLMDCQMPVMDGYEATKRIRLATLPGVNPRVPIIALTAYARAEDRMRALNAGMNVYVSKPIREHELVAALERCGFGVVARAEMSAPEAEAVFDQAALETTRSLRDKQGRPLLAEMVKLYLSDETERLAELEQQVHARQTEALAQDVHSFGGDVASFGGLQVRRIALELEEAARAQNWALVAERMADLKTACSRLKNEIGQLNLIES